MVPLQVAPHHQPAKIKVSGLGFEVGFDRFMALGPAG